MIFIPGIGRIEKSVLLRDEQLIYNFASACSCFATTYWDNRPRNNMQPNGLQNTRFTETHPNTLLRKFNPSATNENKDEIAIKYIAAKELSLPDIFMYDLVLPPIIVKNPRQSSNITRVEVPSDMAGNKMFSRETILKIYCSFIAFEQWVLSSFTYPTPTHEIYWFKPAEISAENKGYIHDYFNRYSEIPTGERDLSKIFNSVSFPFSSPPMPENLFTTPSEYYWN